MDMALEQSMEGQGGLTMFIIRWPQHLQLDALPCDHLSLISNSKDISSKTGAINLITILAGDRFSWKVVDNHLHRAPRPHQESSETRKPHEQRTTEGVE